MKIVYECCYCNKLFDMDKVLQIENKVDVSGKTLLYTCESCYDTFKG